MNAQAKSIANHNIVKSIAEVSLEAHRDLTNHIPYGFYLVSYIMLEHWICILINILSVNMDFDLTHNRYTCTSNYIHVQLVIIGK